MLRHLRAHVADDGLDDRKRNPGNSGEVAERVTAGMKILHADYASSPFRCPRRLNSQSLQKLLDPIGNTLGDFYGKITEKPSFEAFLNNSVSDYGSECRGFESRLPPHFFCLKFTSFHVS